MEWALNLNIFQENINYYTRGKSPSKTSIKFSIFWFYFQFFDDEFEDEESTNPNEAK